MRIEPLPGGVPSDLGAPVLPGSKSHAQRALLLMALGPVGGVLRGVPASGDLEVLIRCLEAVGARVEHRGNEAHVRPAATVHGRSFALHCGENGTAARTLLTMLPLLGADLRLDGSARLRERAMHPATALLRAHGVACDRDALPIHADGRGVAAGPTTFRVDVAATTQVATGAMLAAALRGGSRVAVRGSGALDYLHVTAAVLRAFAIAVDVASTPGQLVFGIGALPPATIAYDVPPDPSARVFVAALAALHGLAMPLAAAGEPHPDLAVDGDLARLQAADDHDLVLPGLAARPDCVPALAAVAACRAGRTTMPGLAILRGKESDRLTATAACVTAAGAVATVVGDDLVVQGPLHAAPGCRRLPTPADHRMVLAMALLGTRLPHGVEVAHGEAVAKSWPEAFAWLARCARVTPVA